MYKYINVSCLKYQRWRVLPDLGPGVPPLPDAMGVVTHGRATRAPGPATWPSLPT